MLASALFTRRSQNEGFMRACTFVLLADALASVHPHAPAKFIMLTFPLGLLINSRIPMHSKQCYQLQYAVSVSLTNMSVQSALDMSNGWTASIVSNSEFQPHVPKANRMEIAVEDLANVDLLSHFPGAVSFIKRARSGGGTVLVHCMAGVSRSVSVRVRMCVRACVLALMCACVSACAAQYKLGGGPCMYVARTAGILGVGMGRWG